MINATTILKGTTCLTAILFLSACGIADRVSAIGKPPEMAATVNPIAQPGYKPVSMPMPTQEAYNTQPNSLWQAKRQTFFKDQRANKVGDVLTIKITIADSASLSNETDRSRVGSESMGAPNVLGFETALDKVLPKAVDPSALIGVNSASTSTGKGAVSRAETINLTLAATVMQLMPNGNFVIQGRQQVLVNNELRDLKLHGIIRPEDILNDNTISYEKIAEAQISYGGKGTVSDLQQPRYGQQFIDAVSPF